MIRRHDRSFSMRLLFLMLATPQMTGCSCTTVPVQEFLSDPAPLQRQTPDEYRILTWNTWLIWPAATHRPERAREIVKRVQGFDIVALQEVFTERDVLIDRLSETYRVIDPDTKIRGRIFGSGLLLLSAYPVEGCWVHRYTKSAGMDALVAKSALYARLVLPTGKLDVIMTHMQAGGDVRLAQLEELSDFVRCHQKPGVPRLIVGDLNIKAPMPGQPPPGRGSDYAELLKTLTDAKKCQPLDVFDQLDHPKRTHFYQSVTYDYRNYPLARLGAVFCKDLKHTGRLDYILCHNSERRLKFSGVQARRFWRKTEAGRVCPLADHYALEAVFSLPADVR